MKDINQHLWKGILILAGLLLLLGIRQNGFHDTMSKAIHICYECIGIG